MNDKKLQKEMEIWCDMLTESDGKTYSNSGEFVFSAIYSKPIDAKKKTVFVSYE